MADVREAIDAIDGELVSLFAKRFTYIDRAAELKPSVGLPPRTADRVQQVLDQVRQHARQHNLDPDLLETIWRALIENSIAREAKAMGYDRDI